MSQDDALSRKAKKAQRDAERQKKGKKRKHAEVDEDEADQPKDELQQDFISLNAGPNETALKRTASGSSSPKSEVRNSDSIKAPKKKKRKAVKQESDKNGVDDEQPAATRTNGKHRFILFIGNLPYSATDATIQSHFQKIAPFTLRHRTDPKTKKSKGFAFLEFENYDRMKTCLKLYHHSIFDPAKQGSKVEGGSEKKRKKDKGRRINVELTAGGGGKSDSRKEKIKARNERLDEQRKRRAELERKEKAKEARKNDTLDNGVALAKSEAEVTEGPESKSDTTDIHPSRLARIKR